MSRCFPFPPPGYIRNGARNEALIESIKLQRDSEKAKQDRKKEKKEKKREERKKEKKERKLKEGEGAPSHGSDSKKLKHIDELKKTKADGKLQKGEDLDTEQLERSGITEEHEQPVSLREPCCLSDSPQSSKRKRSASPTGHDHHGAAIRIRLPLRKHKEPEQPKLDQVVTSNSLIQGSASGYQMHVTNAQASQSLGNSDSRHCKNLVHVDALSLGNSDSRHFKNLVHGGALVTNKRLHDEHKRIADLYNSLFQFPLTVEPLDSEDEGWLFMSDLTEAKPVSKKAKCVTDAVQCNIPSLWPHAQYLPEVEIYALPYSIPY